MTFREIVAINGKPGLYRLLATKSDGAVVRNIDDDSTVFVGARQHTVTALDGIEVYTHNDNMRLYDVLRLIRENAKTSGDFDVAKADNKGIKEYFTKVFPEHDADRVYVSDMKKMIKWSKVLDAKGMLDEVEEQEEVVEEVADTVEEVVPEITEEKKKSKKVSK
jgi:Domain of unknown function (DUF5606)